MHCDQFSQRLQELLDERRDPGLDREVCRHARRCPACRRRLASWSTLSGAWTAPAAGAGFSYRPLAAVTMVVLLLGCSAWWLAGRLQPDGAPPNAALVESANTVESPAGAETAVAVESILVDFESADFSRRGISEWADEKWGPMLDGFRPVAGSLNAAVRAFTPSGVHLQLESVDQASRSAAGPTLPV